MRGVLNCLVKGVMACFHVGQTRCMRLEVAVSTPWMCSQNLKSGLEAPQCQILANGRRENWRYLVCSCILLELASTTSAGSLEMRANFEPEALGAGSEAFWTLLPFVSFISLEFNSPLNSPFGAFLPPLLSLPPFSSLPPFGNMKTCLYDLLHNICMALSYVAGQYLICGRCRCLR